MPNDDDESYDAMSKFFQENIGLVMERTRVLSFAYGLNNEDTASEVQYAFVRAAISWREDGGSSFSNYFWKASGWRVSELALKEKKHRKGLSGKKNQHDPAAEIIDRKTISPLQELVNSEEISLLWGGIRKLPDNERRYFECLLHYGPDHGSRIKIARDLGISKWDEIKVRERAFRLIRSYFVINTA